MNAIDKINSDLDALVRATENEFRRFYVAKCTAVFPGARFFIRNVGAIEFEGRVFRSGITGQADVWGWLFTIAPYPMPLEIELKNVRTKETDEQKAWKAYCDLVGTPHLKLRAKKNETPRQVIDRWVTETGVWLTELRERAA